MEFLESYSKFHQYYLNACFFGGSLQCYFELIYFETTVDSQQISCLEKLGGLLSNETLKKLESQTADSTAKTVH